LKKIRVIFVGNIAIRKLRPLLDDCPPANDVIDIRPYGRGKLGKGSVERINEVLLADFARLAIPNRVEDCLGETWIKLWVRSPASCIQGTGNSVTECFCSTMIACSCQDAVAVGIGIGENAR